MSKDNFARLLSFSFKFLGFICIGFLIFITIYYASSRLLEDKKAKSDINEGKYILNKIAEAYEKILQERKRDLDSERLRLLAEQNSAIALEDKKRIELELRKIEKEKNVLNSEYEKNLKQQKDFEANIKGLEQNLAARSEEIARLNQRNLDLSVELESRDKYWANYVSSFKNSIIDTYGTNRKKIKEIEDNFLNAESGKVFVVNEIKNLYSTVSSREDNVAKVTKEKDTEIKQLQKEISNLAKEIEAKEKELSNKGKEIDKKLKDISKKDETLKYMEGDAKPYIDFYNQYNPTIEKYERLKNLYAIAEKLYSDKVFDKAGQEYRNIINIFEETGSSFERIQELILKKHNAEAGVLLKKARDSIDKKKYYEAYDFLAAILRESPLTNRRDEVLAEILNVAKSTTERDRITIANNKVSQLMTKVDSFTKSKDYDKALETCYQIITEYPYTDYLKETVEDTKQINRILDSLERQKFEDELKKKFTQDYNLYLQYKDKKIDEKARNYYFSGLEKAFGIYTNNSINSFKEFEDKYIEYLITRLIETRGKETSKSAMK